jgi:hypothetical protein
LQTNPPHREGKSELNVDLGRVNKGTDVLSLYKQSTFNINPTDESPRVKQKINDLLA